MRPSLAPLVLSVVSLFAAFSPAAPPPATSASPYKLIKLDTQGKKLETYQFNPAGEIVGQIILHDFWGHAFLLTTAGLQDLGTLGGYSRAYAVNDSSVVVGSFDLAMRQPMEMPEVVEPARAFACHDGRMADLGTLGGVSSAATAVNASGQVAGWALTKISLHYPPSHYAYDPEFMGMAPPPVGVYASPSGFACHPFLYSDGHITDLGTLGGNDDIETPVYINDAGQVAGTAATAAGTHHPFLYANGRMRDLDPAGTRSVATALNAAGQVTFNSWINNTPSAGESSRAYTWHACLYSDGNITDLGNLGGVSAMTTAINASGQVIGDAMLPVDISHPHAYHHYHAFLYSAGKMLDLGDLGLGESRAHAINASGQVVGECFDLGEVHTSLAFLYCDGRTQDLNVLVGNATLAAAGFKDLGTACSISDAGVIMGWGATLDGHDAPFQLIPVTNSAVTHASEFPQCLHFAPGPPGAVDLVRQELPHWSSPGPDRQTDFETQDFSSLTIQPAIPCYSLDTDKLDQGVGPANTQLNGYSYLITSGRTQLASAYVDLDQSGAPELVSLHYRGDDLGALHQLATLDQIRHGSFEPRFLSAAPYLEILWLKSNAGGSDFFYALSSNPPFFQAHQPYPTAEFLKNLAAYLQSEADLHRNDLPGSTD